MAAPAHTNRAFSNVVAVDVADELPVLVSDALAVVLSVLSAVEEADSDTELEAELVAEEVSLLVSEAVLVLVCVEDHVLVAEKLAVEVAVKVCDDVSVLLPLVVADVMLQLLNSPLVYRSSTELSADAAPAQAVSTKTYAELNVDPGTQAS